MAAAILLGIMPHLDRRPFSVLVTDLDNTLFDWFGFWHESFTSMMAEVSKISGIAEDTLFEESREVFQKHGTSEYAFLVQELPSIQTKYAGQDIQSVFAPAFHAYRSARKKTLALYPGVLSTLTELKRSGCLIVGYTESMAFYSNTRVRTLGLDGLLDYLYSPADHDLPGDLTPESLRHYEPETYQLRYTKHRHTPAGFLKPSPAVLLDILREVGARAADTLYVGDNLLKDVSMAQSAGVMDAYAKYGVSTDRPEYELLRRVSHWSPKAVADERNTTPKHISPTVTLNRFDELLELFQPKGFDPARPAADGTLALAVETWKTTVGVQMHFNDLCLRIRSFALTILLGAMGAAGFAMKERLIVHFWGRDFSLAALLLLAGVVGWLACYSMDRWGYHRLLVGAVEHGSKIESKLRLALPEAALTSAIGSKSALDWKIMKVRSHNKIDFFYWLPAVVLIIMAAILLSPRSITGPPAPIAPVAVNPAAIESPKQSAPVETSRDPTPAPTSPSSSLPAKR